MAFSLLLDLAFCPDSLPSFVFAGINMNVRSASSSPLLLDCFCPASNSIAIMTKYPDAASDPFCHGYDTTATFDEPYDIRDWKVLGCLEDPSAQECNLSGPIHPLLDFQSWKGPLRDEDKTYLRPVLRLATAILLSAGSVAFIDAVIYEDRRKIGQRGGHDLTVLDGPSIYSKILKVDIANFFTSLLGYVEFKFVDWDSDEWTEAQGTCAYTDTDEDTRVELDLFKGSGCEFGYASKITIAGAFLNTLTAIHESQQTFQDVNQLLRAQFHLALTICHELIHAVDIAIQEELDRREPYLGDHSLNELGWAWEEVVFGGSIDNVRAEGPIDYSHLEQGQWPLVCTRFPSPIHYYTSLETKLPSPERFIFDRKPTKRTSTEYYLPMSWISRIQQQSTWDDWEQSTNLKWLRIPRRVGTQERNVLWNIDPNWSASQSSEEEWLGCHGRVRRMIQIGRDRLDFKAPRDVKKAEIDAFRRAVAETSARLQADNTVK